MTKWQPIETAPRDGRFIRLGWIVNYPTLDHQVTSRWKSGKWEGNYTPTHWTSLPEPTECRQTS